MTFVKLTANSTDLTGAGPGGSITVNPSTMSIDAACASPGNGTVLLLTSGSGGSSYFVLGFTTVALPPGAVIKSVTNNITVSPGYSAQYADCWRWGAPTRGVRHGPLPESTTTTYSNTNNQNGSGQPPSTQADIDNYQVCVATPGEASYEGFHTYEVWLNLTYVGPPTTGNPFSPSGTVVGTTASAQWSAIPDAAAVTPTRNQVRIFTPAQYQAGGFDPTTSPATWDSGVVAGSGTNSQVVPIPILPNALNYRCYTRSGHTDGGQAQWSTWRFSTYNVAIKSLRYWDGTTFRTRPAKVWNGTAWVDPTNIKIWTGSTWINAVDG